MDDSFLIRWPTCNAKLMVSETRRGQKVACPKCAEYVLRPTEATDIAHALDVNREEAFVLSDRGRRNTANASGQSWQPDSELGFRCPFCQTKSPPIVRKQISTAGWVVFALLLIACFPLSIIGLFIKQEYRVCSSCGIKLG